MTITALPTRPAPVYGRVRETYQRTHKAALIAIAALDAGLGDARDFTPDDLRELALIANTRTPSPTTVAAVTAILDTEREEFNHKATGTDSECIAYNTVRKAVRVARVLWEVGSTDARTLTPWDWRSARTVAEVEPLSEHTKTAVTALIDAWATR